MMKIRGFTLAEVLITLGIIGVVAAMTIPTLMNQTGQAEFKTGFKKAVSVLNQAITMNVALDSNDFSNLTAGDSTVSGSILSMFMARMTVNHTGTSPEIGGAFNNGNNYTLYFNDGMVVTFPSTAASCTSTSKCNMVVDVNGNKGPNTVSNAISTTTGRIADQYYLNFYGQQVVPANDSAKYVLYN